MAEWISVAFVGQKNIPQGKQAKKGGAQGSGDGLGGRTLHEGGCTSLQDGHEAESTTPRGTVPLPAQVLHRLPHVHYSLRPALLPSDVLLLFFTGFGPQQREHDKGMCWAQREDGCCGSMEVGYGVGCRLPCS